MVNDNIKILVTYKKKNKIIESDIIKPIQTGRAISDEIFEKMIGDNTGDNISERNPYYSELTAQYWAWKNYEKIGNPKYIGFMHYRRHFIFNNNSYETNSLGCVDFDNINDEYIKETNIYNSSEIENIIKDFDIIIPNKIELKSITALKNKTPRDAFAFNSDLRVADYDLMIKTILDLYPDYQETINEMESGSIQYWYNMFIMKKECFDKYCEFWWSIISKLEKQIDTSMYGENSMRILGYLSERILGFFVLHERNNYKIKELQISFIKNTNEDKELFPAFSNRNIAISLISSNHYAPYLCTLLQSIFDNASKENNYDIVILTRDITEKNKNKIISQYKAPNFSIRFVEIPFNEKFHIIRHVTVETYMRFKIPSLFSSYDKVLYLDADVVVETDIANLFNIDLKDKKIGAVKDITIQSFINNQHRDDEDYIKNTLELKDIYSIFNGGVILFNIKKIENNFYETLKEMCLKNKYRYLDQDAMNIYFENQVLFLEQQWNICSVNFNKNIQKCIPLKSKQSLYTALNDIKIIHYNSPIKPWTNPEIELSEYWWKYSRKTPFYEEVMARMAQTQSSNLKLQKEIENIHLPNINCRFYANEYNAKLNYVIENWLLFKWIKFRYKIEKALYAGEKQEKYKRKYKNVKQLIKDAKELKKQFLNFNY